MGTDKLYERLTADNRTLVNFNLFPGPDATPETLEQEAMKALDQIEAGRRPQRL